MSRTGPAISEILPPERASELAAASGYFEAQEGRCRCIDATKYQSPGELQRLILLQRFHKRPRQEGSWRLSKILSDKWVEKVFFNRECVKQVSMVEELTRKPSVRQVQALWLPGMHPEMISSTACTMGSRLIMSNNTNNSELRSRFRGLEDSSGRAFISLPHFAALETSLRVHDSENENVLGPMARDLRKRVLGRRDPLIARVFLHGLRDRKRHKV
ncbi:hypothetical protein CPB83DRAFT_841009 [Crepidotus variabilis]|uniref:Uncharacterized protein n=1 Tax=Crepidotus variabilis TaxID=179855 RepID=A0A9P6JHV6_9AGAR|nr:hypothetical protein CPB83DRAFT_841009 [Crepidotus variabilis]